VPVWINVVVMARTLVLRGTPGHRPTGQSSGPGGA
jgi:hypothetical protein